MGYKGNVVKRSPALQFDKIDWGNLDHKRIVTAILVDGVYAGERFRQENPRVPEAVQAAAVSAWVESCSFEAKLLLIDDVDSSIYGTIYEFKLPTTDAAAANAPSYVIAFRGTLFTRSTAKRDIKLNACVGVAALHRASCFQLAMEAIWDDMWNAISAGRTVWLAGHSLGASLATLVGKTMARMGVFLETFLFNPPFLPALYSKIKCKKLKQWFRISPSFLKAWLAVTVGNKGHELKSKQASLANLSSWVPYLFLNPGDCVCSEYIAYFEHRVKMDEIDAGQIEKIASQNSVRASIRAMFGKKSDPVHPLPSAILIINLSPSNGVQRDHTIEQWWQSELQLELKTFLFE